MRQSADPTNPLIYAERISSNKTEVLFLILTLIFILLLIWRVSSFSLDWVALLLSCCVVIFLFYSVNFRILLIRLTPESLKLTIGIFTWMVPVDNIQECSLDELPVIMKYGGAGIHFMSVRKRYRASFNFLRISQGGDCIQGKGWTGAGYLIFETQTRRGLASRPANAGCLQPESR